MACQQVVDTRCVKRLSAVQHGTLVWSAVCVQVLPDDVAAELPGDLLLYSAAEQLHAVLHLPHAHNLHSVRVCLLGHCSTSQQDTRMDVDQVSLGC